MISKTFLSATLLLCAMSVAYAIEDHATTQSRLIADARALMDTAVTLETETRLRDIVLMLGREPANDASRELIERLQQREPQIFVRHDEGPAMIPAVDVGAAARAASRYWIRLATRDTALRDMRAPRANFVNDYATANAAQRLGLLDAVALSRPAELMPYRAELLERVDAEGMDALAAAIGLRLADTALLSRVIAHGSAAVLQSLVSELPSALDPAQSLTLLRQCLPRAEVASMAVFQLGELKTGAAQDLLWDILADPQLGGSAAAALARDADGNTITRLATLLQNRHDTLTQRRAALALSLSGDPEALAIVHDWRSQQ